MDGEAEHGDGGYDTYEPFVFGGAAPAAAVLRGAVPKEGFAGDGGAAAAARAWTDAMRRFWGESGRRYAQGSGDRGRPGDGTSGS